MRQMLPLGVPVEVFWRCISSSAWRSCLRCCSHCAAVLQTFLAATRDPISSWRSQINCPALGSLAFAAPVAGVSSNVIWADARTAVINATAAMLIHFNIPSSPLASCRALRRRHGDRCPLVLNFLELLAMAKLQFLPLVPRHAHLACTKTTPNGFLALAYHSAALGSRRLRSWRLGRTLKRDLGGCGGRNDQGRRRDAHAL